MICDEKINEVVGNTLSYRVRLCLIRMRNVKNRTLRVPTSTTCALHHKMYRRNGILRRDCVVESPDNKCDFTITLLSVTD